MSAILEARGQVQRRKRRRQAPPYPHPLQPCAAPNDVWTTDFKGQFKTGDGVYCYPLTIADGCSRFVLGCTGFLQIDQRQVQPQFQRLFEEYGLPQTIRSDNGPPFSNRGLGLIYTCNSLVHEPMGLEPNRRSALARILLPGADCDLG